MKIELRREHGFSFVELVIVVAVIGIVTALAIPLYAAIQHQARIAVVDASAQSAYSQGVAAIDSGGDVARITEAMNAQTSQVRVRVTQDASGVCAHARWVDADARVPDKAIGDCAPEEASQPAVQTTTAIVGGVLPLDAEPYHELSRSIEIYAADGSVGTLQLDLLRLSQEQWVVNASVGDDDSAYNGMLFFAGSRPTQGTTFTVGGVYVDLTRVTTVIGGDDFGFTGQDGRAARP